jgi:3-oxoacid CoA-transferase subunit A
MEAFLPGLDQSLIDHSTEEWLDTIEDRLDYKAWYCGHWHINKRIDKMHFLMHEVESF